MAPSAVQRELIQSNGYDEELYSDLLEDYSTAVDKTSSSYTPDQNTAIVTYAGPGYGPLNRALRNSDQTRLGEPAFTNKAGKDVTYQGFADHLLAAMNQTRTTRDMVVFRGVKEGALPKLRIGDEITDHGFISTSMDPGEAEGFSENSLGTVLQVSLPKGTPALFGNPDEHELVLGPGSRMKIVGVEPNGHIKVMLI